MSFIQNLFTSRDNNANAETYVGQQDRIWWDPTTNSFYYSDGTTPGGIPVGAGGNPFNQTLNTYDSVTFANINIANTANVTNLNVSGNVSFANTSTVDLGNLTITDQTISGTVTDRNVTLAVAGTANVEMLGAFNIYASGNIQIGPEFSVFPDGQVKISVPVVDVTLGAVEITGTTSGAVVPLGNPGGMLHITGQDGEASRLYNDGVSDYPVYIGRRYNGTSLAPTGVLGGQTISRIAANPYLTNTAGFPTFGTTRIDFVATQDQTTTAQGSKIVLSVTPTGSNVQATVASFDTSGIELTGNLLPLTDNIYSLGNISRRWIGAYFGNAGIYLQDTTLGTTGSLSLDNGIFLMDGNIDGLQIGTGNSIQLTTDGITVSNSTLDINLGTVGDTGTTHILNAGIKFTDDTVQTTAAIPLIQKGAALGVVPLNSATKIDSIYLPAGGPVYKGTWNALTNTPTLADGTGTAGDLYIVSVAGTQDLGSGPITFAIGDEAVYNGTIWQRVAAGAVGVTSFNSRIGAVTLNSSDVTNALSNGSIVNSKLANSNVTINTGVGLAGGGTVALGGTLTLTATGTLNVLGGTGVTVTTADSNATVSIGQPVGTANSVSFLSVTSNTTVQATGNITGGNLATAGRVVATGNIVTSGYVITPSTTINNGIVSTGNITGANLITGGLVTATGNITGGNVIAVANVNSANLNVTGISNLNSNANVKISGGTNGYGLTTDGAGNLSWSVTGLGNSQYYGAFLSTLTQVNGGITTANPVRYDVTDLSSGVSIVANSRITMANTSVYNIQFSLQVDKTDSGTDELDVWLSKNGTNVLNSNTKLQLTGNDAKAVAAWNFVVAAAPGDYFELYWWSNDIDLRLYAQGTQINPTRPAIPSVILTVTQA